MAYLLAKSARTQRAREVTPLDRRSCDQRAQPGSACQLGSG